MRKRKFPPKKRRKTRLRTSNFSANGIQNKTVLVFALLIRFLSISSAVIMPVNQVIKLLSVAAGCILCLREKPVLCGAAAGAGTALVTYFLFAAIAGSISFGWGNVADFAFGALAGAVGGAIGGVIRGR